MNATLPPTEHAPDLAGDMPAAAAIRYYILRRLTDYYPDLAPETASVEVVSRRHAFAKNNHVICHVRARTRQGAWVRRGIYGKTDQLAEQEYANLRELWHAHFRGDAANRIPRPLDYYPGIACF
jgi:hypothetical protein